MSRLSAAQLEFQKLDECAARSTPLARIDPRAKILATAGFIVAVVSCDRYAVAPLLPFVLFPVVIASLGGIPPGLIASKILRASPFAILIGLFNPLLDPQPMAELFGFAVSGGWLSFASIFLRFALTVSAALVLVGSVGFDNVCAGLARLGAPRAMTTQLLFLHRYAMLLTGELSRANLARALRGGGRKALPLPVYASMLGHLLLRALARGERIHLAMASRGFTGAALSGAGRDWSWRDTACVALCWACFLAARLLNPAQALGEFLTGAWT